MIKQINLITLFLCAGQEGPFYLINPSALLYIYYLLSTVSTHSLTVLASALSPGSTLCSLNTWLSVSRPRYFRGTRPVIIIIIHIIIIIIISPHLSWSCSRLPLRHSALGVHCSCSDTILEWRHNNTTHFFCFIMSYLCQCWKIQKKRCQDDCHFELQILSSKIRISLQFPIRVK